MIYNLIFSLTEVTFIFAGLLILHGLRKIIGSPPFYLAIGLLFVFMQFVGGSNLRVDTGVAGLDFPIASSVLLLPFLAALMVTYVSEGTLAAQRLIIGLMTSLGIYLYLAKCTSMQVEWSNELSANESTHLLGVLMGRGLHGMASSVITVTFDLFLIPIIFQRLRNMGCRLVVAVTGSLLLVELIDSAVYATVYNFWNPEWWRDFTDSYLAKAIFTLWLGVIASVYLVRSAAGEEIGRGRRTLDIIAAFFGTYGKTKALEENLRSTEERYRKLVQYAADMIIIMDTDGRIISANPAAERMTHIKLSECPFSDVTGIQPSAWETLLPDTDYAPDDSQTNIFRTPRENLVTCNGVVLPVSGVRCDISISSSIVDGRTMLIVFGRDVTERYHFEKEREELRLQDFHRQRLESIGRLAGGIAHDFNNFLHSIQGHLDIIRYMHPVSDPDVERHLGKVDEISEKAAVLTRQLLGFARKGNYNESEIDIGKIVSSTLELFMPSSAAFFCDVKVTEVPGEKPNFVLGDLIQLQQTLLNILFNARDAMKSIPESRRRINIISGCAGDLGLQSNPPPEINLMPLEHYCAIRIQDSGPGIPEDVIQRIFEPFFTTKPVGEGTGMGLSMAYGTLLAHKGWIQCENAPGGGAVFWMIIPNLLYSTPRAETDSDANNRLNGA